MPVFPIGAQVIRLIAYIVAGGAVALFLQRSIARQLRGRATAEKLLRASETQLAGILAIAADAIITMDETHSIVHFNHGAEEIFGYTAAEIIGQPLEILLPESAVGVHRSHVAGFASSHEPARRMGARREVAGRRRNGEEFPAEASISKLTTATGMLFCVVLRDATDQKHREQHEHLLSVAGARLAGSLDYDATLRVAVELAVPTLGDWCVLDVIEQRHNDTPLLRRVASRHRDPARDEALRHLEARGLDYDSPSAVIDVLRTGKPLLLPEIDASWLEAHSDQPSALADAELLGIHSLMIVPLLARDEVFGAMTIGRALGRPALDEANLDLARAIGFRAALAIDNAAHYRDEQRATMTRDEMLAIVSHDLRNPANAIAMCATALRQRPPELAAERDALLGTIAESAEWMRRLMQDLVDVASIEAGRLSVVPEPQSIKPIVVATIEMFAARARQHSMTLRDEVDGALPLVEADRSRIMQVLTNLVDNALKFTPEGGQIIVSAVRRDLEIEITVQDDGAGIPAENVPHLFERFWHLRGTSHTHGSGLGLAIAKGIVTAHGGRIWVDTNPSGGSAFRFTLPVVE